MSEFNEGDVIRAKKEVVGINMNTLIEAREIVKCVHIGKPITEELYAVEVAHFGAGETTTIRIAAEKFDNFEVIR